MVDYIFKVEYLIDGSQLAFVSAKFQFEGFVLLQLAFQIGQVSVRFVLNRAAFFGHPWTQVIDRCHKFLHENNQTNNLVFFFLRCKAKANKNETNSKVCHKVKAKRKNLKRKNTWNIWDDARASLRLDATSLTFFRRWTTFFRRSLMLKCRSIKR